jgi:hypothetical protein
MTTTTASTAGRLLHRGAGTGPSYWGPGDRYTFLVTGEESGAAYFAMEAFVPPGGGPGPHIHTREDETFYVLEGHVFEEALDTAPPEAEDVPDNLEEVAARYAAVAPSYGMTFL